MVIFALCSFNFASTTLKSSILEGKNMKKTTLKSNRLGRFIGPATLAIGLMVGSSASAEILVQSFSDGWTANRSISSTSEAFADETINQSTLGATVSRYTGTDDLVRVIIRYSRPNEPANVNGSISIVGGSGSTTLDNVNLVAQSTVTAPNSVRSFIFGQTLDLDDLDPIVLSNQVSTGSFTITDSEVETFTTQYSASHVLLDTSIFPSLTSAQLNSTFRDGDASFSFSILSQLIMNYERQSDTPEIQLLASGVDIGSIEIEYYVIPEPGTIALFAIALGSAGLMALRRKRS
jgi:hypothetical protein